MTQRSSSWYLIFGIPYTIQANIYYTPHTAEMKMVSIDKTEDPNIYLTLCLSTLNRNKVFIIILQLQQ